MNDHILDKVSARWGVAPDDAVNFATVKEVDRRLVRLLGGDPRRDPSSWLLALDTFHDRSLPIRSGLSLCCGHGHFERAFGRVRSVQRMLALDVSEPALDSARQAARAEGLSNVQYLRQDINALQLSGEFDFVYGGGVHHLSALEHVFGEVHRHMTDNGVFMMYEYVGPSRCQYSPRLVEAVNASIRLLPERLRVRVSAQRELGVATPQEAMAEMRRRRRVSRLAFAHPVARIPFVRLAPAGGSRVRAESPLTIETPEGDWQYAAQLPLGADEPGRQAPDARLLIRARVKSGHVGIALVGPDVGSVLAEGVLKPSAQPGLVDLPIGSFPEASYLIIRNHPNRGASSEVEIHGMVIGLACDEVRGEGPDAERPDREPLSDDPNFARHFWSSFTPMTEAEWLALDPSEAVRSADIIPVLHQVFPRVEVRYLRSSMVQFVLHDIAANFYDDAGESLDYLRMLFAIEDTLIQTGQIPEHYAYIAAFNRL